MERIVLCFSEEENMLLKECITLTTIKGFPLLRGLLVQSLGELQKEIEEKGSVTCVFPMTEGQMEGSSNGKKTIKKIPVTKEIKDDYDAILNRIPVQRAEFLKFLLIPKLERICTKKQPIGEVIA